MKFLLSILVVLSLILNVMSSSISTYSDSTFREIAKNRKWQIAMECREWFKQCTMEILMERYEFCLRPIDHMCAIPSPTPPTPVQQTTIDSEGNSHQVTSSPDPKSDATTNIFTNSFQIISLLSFLFFIVA